MYMYIYILKHCHSLYIYIHIHISRLTWLVGSWQKWRTMEGWKSQMNPLLSTLPFSESSWCVAVCCSVLQYVAACCSVLQCIAVCCRVLQRVTVCCSVLQRVAVCCSVLHCVVVCCGVYGKLVDSRIRRYFPTRPLHVTSLQDCCLFYYYVPHKTWRDSLISNPCRIFAILSTPSPLPWQFTPPRLGLCFPDIEPMFDCYVCFG